MKDLISVFNIFDIDKRVFYLYDIPVVIKDSFSFIIQSKLTEILDRIETKIPKYLLLIDSISIEYNDYFKNNSNVKTYFQNKQFFISTDFGIINDFYYQLFFGLLYNIAYNFHNVIFDDGLIEKEYVNKKLSLYKQFNKQLLQSQKLTVENFIDSKQNKFVINFLFKKLRQNYVNKIIDKLFPHSSSVYSLLDYFVVFCYISILGFKSQTDCEKMCPEAYEKYSILFKYSKGDMRDEKTYKY